MSVCVPVLTPGQCGSSLLLQILEDFGFHAPAGSARDGRHPCGYHDEMSLIQPQIDGDRHAYEAEVRDHARKHDRWAFKLQSGALLWHGGALSVLPNPRLVYYDREDRDRVLALTGRWGVWFYKEVNKVLESRTYLRLTFEQLLADPKARIEQLYAYTLGGPIPDLYRAVSRVQKRES